MNLLFLTYSILVFPANALEFSQECARLCVRFCAGRGPASARGNVKGPGKIFACLSGARVRAMWRVGSRTEQRKRKLGEVMASFSRQPGKRP